MKTLAEAIARFINRLDGGDLFFLIWSLFSVVAIIVCITAALMGLSP